MSKTGWLGKQWPWWTAGVMTGLAEAINYWFIPYGHPKHKFIGVTSGMARMLAGLEARLFGRSLIATKPDYQPSIQWIIIGALLAGLVLVWLEGETRTWVRYPKTFYVFTALGAFMFAWGTRVAGGCTLHHLLGGWSALNVKSFVVMITATIAAAIGIAIMSKFGLVQYFKSQETKWYVEEAKKRGWADGLTLDDSYNPNRDWLRLALYAFWAIFAIVIVINAIFGVDYAIKMGWADSLAKTKMAGVMINAKNLPNIVLWLIVGGLLGASVAKTGIGTECAVLNAEMGPMIARDELGFAKKWKMPYSLRTIFMAMQPFTALAVHIIIASTAFFIGFAVFGIMEGHHWATESFAEAYAAATGLEFHHTGVAIREMTSLPMDLFGGFLLGMGTVFMLGCEFRNYGRTGMLYITGLLIWPFFYLGYLPYTLARDFWDGLMGGYPYTDTTFLPAMIAKSYTGQIVIWLLWILLWVGLLVFALRTGSKAIGVSIKDLLTKNSEELYMLRLERLERENPELAKRIDEVERKLASQAAPL